MKDYATQLLPDAPTARLIRRALAEFMSNHPEMDQNDQDRAWLIIGKISSDLLHQ